MVTTSPPVVPAVPPRRNEGPKRLMCSVWYGLRHAKAALSVSLISVRLRSEEH